ncbi:transposase [Okeania sp. KiyG1]|uniref:transposase n=1 Tax=Okeania sp. KiyG1 TaxID=2720165 RepID=UPI0035C9399F
MYLNSCSVVMDRASIYTRDKMSDKLSEWKEKKLEIFWCPTYLPKHNLIEILCKFINYE